VSDSPLWDDQSYIPRPVHFAIEVFVGSDPYKEEHGARAAVADLRLQANIGKGMAQLLKLGDGGRAICEL
jgi:hypothetical protein